MPDKMKKADKAKHKSSTGPQSAPAGKTADKEKPKASSPKK